jgi:hypothetical protein
LRRWPHLHLSTKEHDMKVKTKVKAGPRDCGGGGPIAIDGGI